MAEDRRGVATDQPEQDAVLLGVRDRPQGVREGRGGVAVLAVALQGLEGLLRLGQVGEQGAGADRGERGDEGPPVHVGHGHELLVALHRLHHRGDREPGGHGKDAAAPELGEGGLVHAHADLVEGSPGDRRRPQPTGAAPLDQGVEDGVGRSGRTLAAAAPHARDRGEDDERVERSGLEQLVQPHRGVHLGREHPGEVLHPGVVDGAGLRHVGGVHHGRDRLLGGCLGDQLRDRVPVGVLARLHRGGDAQSGQFGPQVRHAPAGCLRGRGDDEPVDAGLREPHRDVLAESLGAAGHQDRAPGLPAGVAGGLRDGLAHQAPGVHTRSPDRELVLVGSGVQHSEQVPGRTRVAHGRQVDQTAPPVEAFQRGGAAEAPQRRLHR